MPYTAILMLALVAPSANEDAKKGPPAAKVTVTAESACLHCTFGVGDSCALCLKLDETTPVVLEGKPSEEFFENRLTGALLVVEGTLSVNKDKRLVLTTAKARPYTDKDKGKAPEKGEVRVSGTPYLARDGGVALRNGAHPIMLDGKLADRGKEAKSLTASGKMSLDKGGTVRLAAKKVEPTSEK
jgi:hypothetical protein